VGEAVGVIGLLLRESDFRLPAALNAFAVGELLFFAGPKKSNQKKGPSAQEHTFRDVGSRDFPTRHPWLGRKTARVLRAALRVLLRTAIQKLLAARATACLVLAFA
jgi:hypothetical protein